LRPTVVCTKSPPGVASMKRSHCRA
jgi:hypothetical protein